MTAAWGGICCSRPPCVTISLRETTYTYGNIMRRKAYTVNIASERHVKEVDYFGIVSGREEDKFSETGLTAVDSELVDAPYIKEFPLVLECKVIHILEIRLHTAFIGEIMDVKIETPMLDKNGFPDIEKIRPIIFTSGSRTYHGVGEHLGQAFKIGEKRK